MPKSVGRRNFATKEELEELVRLYHAGLTYKQIAERLGMSTTWASSTCMRMIQKGVMVKRQHVKKPTQDSIRRGQEIPYQQNIDTGKVFALAKAGWNVNDIAEDMLLNPGQVAEVLESGK